MSLVGYGYLIQHFGLLALPLPVTRIISDAIGSRRQRDRGGQLVEEFAPSYAPEPTLLGHLGFALRYEGLNLEVLQLLFDRTGGADIQAALDERSIAPPTRRIAYLFEWLTGEELELRAGPLDKKLRYVPVLDEKLQFGLALEASPRVEKFRIIDNLPGTPAFCPLVRRTPYLERMIGKRLKERACETLGKYAPQLVRRAAVYLYLKETHSSFEVERVKPTTSRARRFAELLQEADTGTSLSEERFVDLQNAVVEPRWMEASYRLEQNWLGTDLGYRKKVDFVPPRPEDVRSLMDGLIAMSKRIRERPGAIDPVIAASVISFGFVFVHPFKDGNGRLHRYLIHEQLAAAGFMPKGIILPVSAVILANLDRYQGALEQFSHAVNARSSYDPDVPAASATGNDAVYFRYFDATGQASFLYDALERTVEHDLDEEISYLLGFDRARGVLANMTDWPAHSLDLFIRVVRQNGGRLSATKRASHFAWLTDEEVGRFQLIVERAFTPEIEAEDILAGQPSD
jgi:Fic/DOC family